MKFEAITRTDLMEEINDKIDGLIALLDRYVEQHPTLANDDNLSRVLFQEIKSVSKQELEMHNTISDLWMDLGFYVGEGAEELNRKQISRKLNTIGFEVLRRNLVWDDVEFCPLCGEIAVEAKHNGAPIIDARVCEKCNRRVVIPGRIALTMEEQVKKYEGSRKKHAESITKYNNSKTPEERRELARKAVTARWEKMKGKNGK